MVKRAKSPEIKEDIRLFCVYLPYPLNANWEDPEDQKACATWVAECIGNKYHLINIHRKPSSRGMIILEISKAFTDHGLLLGEHKWQSFLRNPTHDEIGCKTRVYHTIYSTTRNAYKDGWRPIPVRSAWFDGWAPGKDRIVQPYPNTEYCPPPVEDVTNKSICSPLPKEVKPAPPKPAPLTVGSPAWVKKQQEPKPTVTELKTVWKNQNGAPPSLKSPNLPPRSNSTGIPISPAWKSSTPKSPTTPGTVTTAPTAKGKSSRAKPIPLQQFVSEGSKARQPPSWGPQPPKSADVKSPFTEEPPTGPQNAWNNKLKIVPLKPAKVTDSIIENDWGKERSVESWYDDVELHMASDGTPKTSNSAWSTRPPSPGPSSAKPTVTNNERKSAANAYEEEDASHIDAHLEGFDVEDEGGEETLEDLLAPWQKSAMAEPAVVSDEPAYEQDDEWGNEWALEEEKKDELKCPAHGVSCAKKICIDYSNMMRAKKREEERQKREKDMKEGKGRGRGRGRKSDGGDWRANAPADGTTEAGSTEQGADASGFQIQRNRGRKW